MCAEAAAIAAMISDGANEIIEIAIVGSADQPCSPCGACRQKLREFANPQLLVHMYGQHGNSLSMPLTELLPVSFGPEFLRN
jgi:cytidine deaminase